MWHLSQKQRSGLGWRREGIRSREDCVGQHQNRGEGLFQRYVSNLPLGQLSSWAIKGGSVCVCSGASQFSNKLRTQPPNPQNEKRCLFSSCNKKQENKTRKKGAEEDKMLQVLQSQETTNPPSYGWRWNRMSGYLCVCSKCLTEGFQHYQSLCPFRTQQGFGNIHT